MREFGEMLVVQTVGAGALVNRWRAVLEAGSHVAGGEEEEARTVAGALDGEEEHDGGKQAACKGAAPCFWDQPTPMHPDV